MSACCISVEVVHCSVYFQLFCDKQVKKQNYVCIVIDLRYVMLTEHQLTKFVRLTYIPHYVQLFRFHNRNL